MTACFGVVLVNFAALDNWRGFYAALPALVAIAIAAVAVTADRPQGYLQRTALGLFAFLFFGVCLSHISFVANGADYRPMLLLLLLATEANDVFAYISGRLFGRRKLAPETSPNKTIGGSLGALVCTTILVFLLGRTIFTDGAMSSPWLLLALGFTLSFAGQMGDLMLSSIKRDVGIKDMGVTIPGHGGLLDRFDSLILTAPAFFHFVNYFGGFDYDPAVRIWTGGWAG